MMIKDFVSKDSRINIEYKITLKDVKRKIKKDAICWILSASFFIIYMVYQLQGLGVNNA